MPKNQNYQADYETLIKFFGEALDQQSSQKFLDKVKSVVNPDLTQDYLFLITSSPGGRKPSNAYREVRETLQKYSVQCPTDGLLIIYHDGHLDELTELKEYTTQHIKHCERCKEIVEAFDLRISPEMQKMLDRLNAWAQRNKQEKQT